MRHGLGALPWSDVINIAGNQIRPIQSVMLTASEFDSRLECNHPWRTVAAQPDAEQSRRRRSRIAQGSESGLRGRFARDSRVPQNRETEIRVIEHVEELTVDAQLHALRQLKPLGQIQVAPEEIRAAQCIPAEIAELAILRTVAAGTGAGAWIDDGNKRVRVEPLDRAG